MKPLTPQERRIIRATLEEGVADKETAGYKKTAPWISAVAFGVAFAALVLLAWVLLKLSEAVFG